MAEGDHQPRLLSPSREYGRACDLRFGATVQHCWYLSLVLLKLVLLKVLVLVPVLYWW